MIAPPYTYRAEVRRIVDGDTIAMDVDDWMRKNAPIGGK